MIIIAIINSIIKFHNWVCFDHLPSIQLRKPFRNLPTGWTRRWGSWNSNGVLILTGIDCFEWSVIVLLRDILWIKKHFVSINIGYPKPESLRFSNNVLSVELSAASSQHPKHEIFHHFFTFCRTYLSSRLNIDCQRLWLRAVRNFENASFQ